MPRSRRTRSLAGKSRVGCLVTLLILAGVGYYGYTLGGVYLRYWRFKEAIKSEARLAPSLDDAAIRRRLRSRAEELGLPEEAQLLKIQRRLRPREIRISTTYDEPVDLLFFTYTFTLSPEVRNPL